jgi:hypothetical protein
MSDPYTYDPEDVLRSNQFINQTLDVAHLGTEISREIRNSETVRMLFTAAANDAKAALYDLANADPTDWKLIVKLQARVRLAWRMARYVSETVALGGEAVKALETLDAPD